MKREKGNKEEGRKEIRKNTKEKTKKDRKEEEKFSLSLKPRMDTYDSFINSFRYFLYTSDSQNYSRGIIFQITHFKGILFPIILVKIERAYRQTDKSEKMEG